MPTRNGGAPRIGRRSALKKGALLAGAGIVGLSGSATAAEPITDCTVVDEPGEYALQNDISHTGDGACIRIEGYLEPEDLRIHGNGHAISGDGRGVGIAIDGSSRYDIFIDDLTIVGFETGISNPPPTFGFPLYLESVSVVENGTGIKLRSFADVTARRSSINNNDGPAIDTNFRNHVSLERCTVHGNGGAAVTKGEEDTVYVENSTVSHNGGGIVAGVVPTAGEITNNEIHDNDGFGIALDDFPFTTGGEAPIVGNDIHDNGGPGIRVSLGTGIIRENEIRNNQHGVLVEDDPHFDPSAVVERNNVVENDGYGVIDERDDPLEATCNYWGHATGPRHDDNPRNKPKGQPISGSVAFEPWSVREIRDGEGTCTGGRGGGN